MKRSILWLGILLVLLTDAVVLEGVWRNRSGETEAVLELSERELPLTYTSEDNSGIALRLTWIGRNFYGPDPENQNWFDEAKLGEIGFDIRVPATDPAAEIRYRRVLPRKAFVALEYDGEAWQQWLSHQREVSTHSGVPLEFGSRLVAIDVAADAARLRQRYPNRKKYLIVRGLVRLHRWQKWDPQINAYSGPSRLRGDIQEILPGEIHVPLPFAEALAKRPKHFTVGLAYGKNFEPWVISCRAE